MRVDVDVCVLMLMWVRVGVDVDVCVLMLMCVCVGVDVVGCGVGVFTGRVLMCVR